MKLRTAAILALLCAVSPLQLAAQSTPPVVIFTVDADYNYNNKGVGLIGAMIDNAGNKRTAQSANALNEALGLDVLAQALPVITCEPSPDETSACPSVPLPDATPDAIKTILEQKNVTEGVLVRYFAMFNVAELWSRLVVQPVKIRGKSISQSGLPITAYYISRLTDEEINLAGQPWKEGTPPRLENEVRASWLELRDMWRQIEADAAGGANPQKKWKSAAKVQAHEGWTFRCRGISGCSGQHIVRETDDRVWITAGNGASMASINKSQAAFASNFMALMIR